VEFQILSAADGQFTIFCIILYLQCVGADIRGTFSIDDFGRGLLAGPMRKFLVGLFTYGMLISALSASADDCRELSGAAEKLFEAVSKSDVAKVQALIAKVDLNSEYRKIHEINCVKPLRYALHFYYGQEGSFPSRLKIIAALLKGGAAPKDAGLAPFNWPGNESETIQLLEVLRNAGYDLTAEYPKRNGYGTSSLLVEWSAYGNSPEILRYLVRAGANVNANVDNSRKTPLTVAITRCKAQEDYSRIDPHPTIQMLLSLGAEMNDAKNLPLEWAIMSACIDNAKVLLEAGANVSVLKATFPNAIARYVESAAAAAEKRRIDNSEVLAGVQLLISLGLDVGGQEPALPVAVTYPIPEVVSLLIAHGADPNQGYMDYRKGSPLTIATSSRFDSDDNVRELLKARADINYRDDGQTALHLAAYHGHVGQVAVLLDGGADVNSLTDSGNTPLTMAIQGLCYQKYGAAKSMVQLLLSRRANPKLDNALQSAVDKYCSPDVIRLILAAGG
jgi:ankyrin repeat protein